MGYGAVAICPYLALESVRAWWSDTKTQNLMQHGKVPNITVTQAQARYRTAVENGLLKILSKMGISLLSSYQEGKSLRRSALAAICSIWVSKALFPASAV
jgi:glutamate synthase (ferredoxin)